jgi:2-oxoglutarate ferredoxin oxidoreductase subunit alpha
LPTRTEQGDLELALYAGHGEFPRIILAPGTLDDGFHLAQQAFNLADKYQVPVFILTDQYYIDSYYDAPPFDLSKAAVEKHVVKTAKDYRRYVITQDGVFRSRRAGPRRRTRRGRQRRAR